MKDPIGYRGWSDIEDGGFCLTDLVGFLLKSGNQRQRNPKSQGQVGKKIKKNRRLEFGQGENFGNIYVTFTNQFH